MDTLSAVMGPTPGWVAWTGVAALVLILMERLIPRFTWWTLCRTLPYVVAEWERTLLRPMGRWKGYWLWFLSLLWPRPYRVFANRLVYRYNEEVSPVLRYDKDSHGELNPLPVDPKPAFLEARLYEEKRKKRRMRRPAVRAHRDGYFRQRIKCANGCGTSYGKSRLGFSTDAPLNGWSCTANKCSLLEPHHCSQCSAVFRGASADP